MRKSTELDLNEPPSGYGGSISVLLEKDRKQICRVNCPKFPFEVPSRWTIREIRPLAKYGQLEFPCCHLYPEPENPHQEREWPIFLKFLQKYAMVAYVNCELCDLYILASDVEKDCARLLYRNKNANGQELQRSDPCQQECAVKTPSRFQTMAKEKDHTVQKNFVRTDPSYLVTLSQAHSGWIFGAIAELVDNARDANASRLDISIEHLYSRTVGQKIPVLSIVDDGHGMCHEEVIRMLSFGHKQTNVENERCIGQFGIGFKTGAMRLGRDAIVLTQCASSRSVALLSQSFNEGKENLETPIITYSKRGEYMDLDLSLHSQASANRHLQAVKEFSPFNEYVIGQKIGIFGEHGTGTQIYIWNLDRWGSDYSLEWKKEVASYQESQGDILIRSRRVRSRPGQISQMVPLDYSLRAYLEVIFLEPRIKIYIQGSLVNSRPLAKNLSKTVVLNGKIMGNPIKLMLGLSQDEWDRMNCGMFLYWRGRLIEAYKRVGGMVHNADMGRGVLGVVDVTNIMKDMNGRVWVLNNKQGFQDCEAYAKLEEWLGSVSDKYWDDNFDKLHLQKGCANLKPDNNWVQCNKCRKWRILPRNFDAESLPLEWFCCMPPFNGKCEYHEQPTDHGVITISAKRSGCDNWSELETAFNNEEVSAELKNDSGKIKNEAAHVECSLIRSGLKSQRSHASEGQKKFSGKRRLLDHCDDLSAAEETAPNSPFLKRLRRGPPRNCKQP